MSDTIEGIIYEDIYPISLLEVEPYDPDNLYGDAWYNLHIQWLDEHSEGAPQKTVLPANPPDPGFAYVLVEPPECKVWENARACSG